MQPRSHSPVGASPSVTHSLSLAPTTVAVSHSHPSDIRLPHTVPLPLTRCLSHTRLSLSSLYSLSLTLSRCLSHSLFLPLDALYSRSEDPPSCNAIYGSLTLTPFLARYVSHSLLLSLSSLLLVKALSLSLDVCLSLIHSLVLPLMLWLSLALPLARRCVSNSHSLCLCLPPPAPLMQQCLCHRLTRSLSLVACLSLTHRPSRSPSNAMALPHSSFLSLVVSLALTVSPPPPPHAIYVSLSHRITRSLSGSLPLSLIRCLSD